MPSLYDNHQVEKERFWRNRKNAVKRMFMLELRIHFFVCGCRLYMCIVVCGRICDCLFVCVYVCVCVCVCVMIHALHGRFEVVSWIYVQWCVATVSEVKRRLEIWPNKIFFIVCSDDFSSGAKLDMTIWKYDLHAHAHTKRDFTQF